MPKVFLKAGKMNLDKGSIDGDHLWVAKDVLLTDHGYESIPKSSELVGITLGAGSKPCGAIMWRGGGTERIYYSSSNGIREIYGSTVTNVTRASGAYTNITNGSSFAAYGDKCYHSNGIDKINSIIVPSTTATTAKFTDITYTATGAIISPKYICSHKNHLIGANIKMLDGYSLISTGTATPGLAFTNQPANDGVEIVSADAGDTTQIITIAGTTTGTDTVVLENVTLNGTTVVSTTKVNWGVILRVTNNSLTGNAGVITVREASGDLAITTIPIAAGPTHVGNSLVSISAGDSYVSLLADDATTKQIGITGTDSEGNIVYDSQALNGTTAVLSNVKFRTVTGLFVGDLEVARTVTINSYQFVSGVAYEHLLWISGTDNPEGYGDPQVAPTIIGSDYRQLMDGTGKITGVIDGGDCFFVFKTGCIYRFDGPPWQWSIISYNVGMPFKHVPYKQGDRIYFWSYTGLRYIDTTSNEIVDIFSDVMSRSVVDWHNPLYNTIGSFPKQNSSTMSLVNSAITTERASISGDSRYGLVFVVYGNEKNPYGPSGVQILCYNTNLEAFSLISGPTGLYSSLPIAIEFFDEQATTSSTPMSALRVILITASTTHTVYNWTYSGLLNLADGAEPYFRWPLKGVEPNEARTRITKVRPIFDLSDLSVDSQAWDLIKIETVSISGQGKVWSSDGTYLQSYGTYSQDGWYDVSGCPFSDRHSIGVHLDGTIADGRVNPYALQVTSFIGIEVEYESSTSRST